MKFEVGGYARCIMENNLSGSSNTGKVGQVYKVVSYDPYNLFGTITLEGLREDLFISRFEPAQTKIKKGKLKISDLLN